MIIWVGYTNGSLSCRFLGRGNNNNSTDNSILYKLPAISMTGDTLCHNGGTVEHGGTILCIGPGDIMNMKQYAMCGYCVGNTLSVPDALTLKNLQSFYLSLNNFLTVLVISQL